LLLNGLIEVGGGSSGTLPTRIEATVAVRLNEKIKSKTSIAPVLSVILDIHRLPREKDVSADLNLSRRAVYRGIELSPPWRWSFVSRIGRF
jgi:hypothetical protein